MIFVIFTGTFQFPFLDLTVCEPPWLNFHYFVLYSQAVTTKHNFIAMWSTKSNFVLWWFKSWINYYVINVLVCVKSLFCRSMLPVQPGPAISLELDVDDGEVENYEVCSCHSLAFWFCISWCAGWGRDSNSTVADVFSHRLCWTLLSAWERLNSGDWPRET